jgi:hypothetical protein
MRALVVVAIAIAVCAASADTPLPPPAEVTAMSPGGRIRAISDSKAGTRVEVAKRHRVLWSLPGWHRSLFVADSGNHLGTQHEGLNLHAQERLKMERADGKIFLFDVSTGKT